MSDDFCLVSLEELRLQVAQEARNKAPYSHNIIGLVLRQIDKVYGRTEANKTIDDFGLKQLGWSYEICEHCGHWPCGCGG